MSLYRHVRLTSGQATLIGYVPDIPGLHVGQELELQGQDGRWRVRYVSEIVRDDVAGCRHAWEAKPA